MTKQTNYKTSPKLSDIDCDIIQYLIIYDSADNGCTIARAKECSGSSEHRNLYNQRIDYHIKQGTLYRDKDNKIRICLSNVPAPFRDYLRMLAKDKTALKRIVNQIINPNSTVKIKTIKEDMDRISKKRDVVDNGLKSIGL